MLLVSKHNFQQVPPWPYGINPDSPQAVGLEVWVTFPAGGAGYVLPQRGRTTGINLFRADPTGGYGRNFDQTVPTPATLAYGDAPFITAQGITIMWSGRIDDVAGIHGFAFKGVANGATDTPFDFRTGGIDTTSIALVRSNAGGLVIFTSQTGLVSAGTYGIFAVRVTDNLIETLPDFFVNGNKFAGGVNGGSGTGAVTGTAQDIIFGGRQDGVAPMDGYCREIRIYNRALSDGVIQSMATPETQFDLWWSPTNAATFAIATGGGGGAGKGPGGGGKKGGGGGLNVQLPLGASVFNIGNPGLDIGST